MFESDHHISYELRDKVALIGIDRAPKRNAMTHDMFQALGRASLRAQRDAKVAIIFSHNEDFSAGLDLLEQSSRDATGSLRESRAQHAVLDIVAKGGIPFLAALQGATIGAGLEIASAVHIRVGDETAYFALPEGKRGIFVGGGGSVRISRLIGVACMTELMLTSRTVKATEAFQRSLLQFIAPKGGALELALDLAHGIAKNSTVSNYAIVNGISRIRNVSEDDGLFFESVLAALVSSGPEAQAGLREFLEKRASSLKPA